MFKGGGLNNVINLVLRLLLYNKCTFMDNHESTAIMYDYLEYKTTNDQATRFYYEYLLNNRLISFGNSV